MDENIEASITLSKPKREVLDTKSRFGWDRKPYAEMNKEECVYILKHYLECIERLTMEHESHLRALLYRMLDIMGR